MSCNINQTFGTRVFLISAQQLHLKRIGPETRMSKASSFLTKGQYGLIIPGGKKAAAKPVARPSAFGDSSSDEVSSVNTC